MRAIFIKSVFSLSLIISASAQAGMSYAQLNCKSASGRTTIDGVIPNYGSYVLDIDFKIDHSKTKFYHEEAGKYQVVNNQISKGTFSMDTYEDQASGHLILNAVKKTVRYAKTKNGYRSSFTGIISAKSTDPRTALPISEKTNGQDIYVACTLVDEI